jgi:hypothetical protein
MNNCSALGAFYDIPALFFTNGKSGAKVEKKQ